MTSGIQAALLAPALLLAYAAPVLATARFNPETGVRLHRTRLAAGEYHACTILDDGSVLREGSAETEKK